MTVTMLQRDREGLHVCRAAWLTGVSLRKYRELEAREGWPDATMWARMCEVFDWPLSLARSLDPPASLTPATADPQSYVAQRRGGRSGGWLRLQLCALASALIAHMEGRG
jgi:hypothetical protein